MTTGDPERLQLSASFIEMIAPKLTCMHGRRNLANTTEPSPLILTQNLNKINTLGI